MKFIIIFNLQFFITIICYGQFETKENEAFFAGENSSLASFIGGNDELQKVIKKNLIYPKAAFKEKLEGKVICGFTIDTLGKPINIKIIKGVREDLDNETVRVIELLTDWIPAKVNGKKCKMQVSLPINFKLKSYSGN